MFDLLTPTADTTIHAAQIDAALPRPMAPAYTGPERRAAHSMLTQLLSAMLDEIDYGMLLLTEDAQALHVNHVARAELDDEHPLQMLGRELRARRSRDVAPLCQAITDACQRGLRRLVALGEGLQRVTVAVVPLPQAALPGGGAHAPRGTALLLLGKRQVCEDLSVEAFARAHGLTAAEIRVLKALCAGTRPGEIALQHGVGLATVRTQIGSIRAKTGAENIGAIVRIVSVLPPMVSALRCAA